MSHDTFKKQQNKKPRLLLFDFDNIQTKEKYFEVAAIIWQFELKSTYLIEKENHKTQA